jgi:hypothetical protein
MNMECQTIVIFCQVFCTSLFRLKSNTANNNISEYSFTQFKSQTHITLILLLIIIYLTRTTNELNSQFNSIF